MRHFALFILIIALAACSTAPSVQQPLTHTLDINVSSATDAKVEVAKEVPLTDDQRAGMGLGRLSQLSWINDARTKAFIKIFSGLSVADVTRLWNDLMWLYENTDIRDVDLFINSPGGDAFSGLALSDQVERAEKLGFTITAHASGIIASAAVPVFTVCSKRYAAPGTIFMVHEAALWKWPGRETASDIRSQNELMELLRDRYIGYLVSHSTTSRAEWEDMEHRTSWFNADKAVELGICDAIE